MNTNPDSMSARKNIPMLTRVMIDRPPFPAPRYEDSWPWNPPPAWPARWLRPPKEWESPVVMAFALRLDLKQPLCTHIHVSADERYELWLNGKRYGRGPERGDQRLWAYETFKLELPPGEHVLAARVWALGPFKPWAQETLWSGFICAAEGDAAPLIDTGRGLWHAKKLDGYNFYRSGEKNGVSGGYGGVQELDAAKYPWDWTTGLGEGWVDPIASDHGNNGWSYFTSPRHLLVPASLPPQLDKPFREWHVAAADRGKVATAWDGSRGDADDWEPLLQGGRLLIESNSQRRVVIELGDYVCGYPAVSIDGGKNALVSIAMIETPLFDHEFNNTIKGSESTKANRVRGLLPGTMIRGDFDSLMGDGGRDRRLAPLWWRSGCWIELAVETGDEAVELHDLELHETGYPFDVTGKVCPDDGAMQRALKICERTWRACAHETFMDCAFYEQRMFPGDTRVQALITYALSVDDRLPKKALRLFDSSRFFNPTGLVKECHPCPFGGIIPPYSLIFVDILRDYAWWRGDPETVSKLLPGARNTIDIFLDQVPPGDVLITPNGWNFIDWVPGFHHGKPPGAEAGGRNVCVNWHLVHAIGHLAEVEAAWGEPELADRMRRYRTSLVAAMRKRFWDDNRGIFAEDESRTVFSEHAQILALLSGTLDENDFKRVAAGLVNAPDLVRTGAYYSHYLFEGYRTIGRIDLLLKRLDAWIGLEKLGLRTTPEHFHDDCRSDCHAWTAHPVFHYLASIIGLRPDAPGFKRVRLTPQLGPLQKAAGEMAHPLGPISVSAHRMDKDLRVEVTLPVGLNGVCDWLGHEYPIVAGKQVLELKG